MSPFLKIVYPVPFPERIWDRTGFQPKRNHINRSFWLFVSNAEGVSNFFLHETSLGNRFLRQASYHDVAFTYSLSDLILPILSRDEILLVEPRRTTVIFQSRVQLPNDALVCGRVAQESADAGNTIILGRSSLLFGVRSVALTSALS